MTDYTSAIEIRNGLMSVADAIHKLGTGNAATSMGAVEALALEIRHGSERIAEALGFVAAAIEGR
jgi:hypothetical protein